MSLTDAVAKLDEAAKIAATANVYDSDHYWLTQIEALMSEARRLVLTEISNIGWDKNPDRMGR